ncbi:hypothetical protein D3C83_226260 [compost metagenome]
MFDESVKVGGVRFDRESDAGPQIEAIAEQLARKLEDIRSVPDEITPGEIGDKLSGLEEAATSQSREI